MCRSGKDLFQHQNRKLTVLVIRLYFIEIYEMMIILIARMIIFVMIEFETVMFLCSEPKVKAMFNFSWMKAPKYRLEPFWNLNHL
jgi:hypothetical protein